MNRDPADMTVQEHQCWEGLVELQEMCPELAKKLHDSAFYELKEAARFIVVES